MGRAEGAYLSALVLDASVVGAWYIPTQATQEATALYALGPRSTWRAPHCFSYEAHNLLLRYERQGLLRAGAAEDVEADLRNSVKVVIEPAPDRGVTGLALKLARTHGISLFDGFYLLLGLELKAPLVTRDGGLAAAALRERCEVLDVRTAA